MGTTFSSSFPTVGGFQSTFGGGTYDAFLVEIVPTEATLVVRRSGSGTGGVVSEPLGIDCGTGCSEDFAIDSTVTLTANPDVGSVFLGWSGGGCSGSGTCAVTMGRDQSVTALFAPPGTIFADDLESGDTTAWSETVP